MLAQQPTESCCCSEPLIPKLKSTHKENLTHIFRAHVRPLPPRALGWFTKLFVGKKSTSQSSERVVDKYPSTGPCPSSQKKVRRWLTVSLSSTLSILSGALCKMSHSRRQGKPRRAGAEAEQVVFCTNALTRDEWITRILDELKSDGGRAQAMDALLRGCRVGRTDVFKKTRTTQHEYLVVGIMRQDEGQEYTLRFDRRYRGTGADDPSPDDRPNSPCSNANICSRGIMGITQMIHSLWDGSTRITSVCGTDAMDRVWSDPNHQICDIIVRSIHYTQKDSPSLLDLIAAFDTVSNQCPKYSIGKCHHCYWLADSLSAVLEHTSPHKVVTAADLQGKCKGIRLHVRNNMVVNQMVESMKNRRGNFKVNVRLHAA